MGKPLGRNHIEPREGDVRDSQADHALLTSLFPGIEPVELVVGLRKTMEWMRSRDTQ